MQWVTQMKVSINLLIFHKKLSLFILQSSKKNVLFGMDNIYCNIIDVNTYSSCDFFPFFIDSIFLSIEEKKTWILQSFQRYFFFSFVRIKHWLDLLFIFPIKIMTDSSNKNSCKWTMETNLWKKLRLHSMVHINLYIIFIILNNLR